MQVYDWVSRAPPQSSCKLLLPCAGVAQHKQGDLEAALQAFACASADALSAAGLSQAALGNSAATSSSSAAPGQGMPATNGAVPGAGLSDGTMSGQSAVSCRSGEALQTVQLDHSSRGTMAETVAASSFMAEHAPGSSTGPPQGFLDLSHASQSMRGDACSEARSQAGAAASSDSRDAQASAMAERTAVRALMAQASVLKHSGRLHDAMHAMTLAAVLDPGAEVHKQKLQAELDCCDQVGSLA